MIYNLCERIAELRNTFGLTQSDLAKRLEVTRSAVTVSYTHLTLPTKRIV